MEMDGTLGRKKGFWSSLSNFQRGFLIVFVAASIFSFISPILLGESVGSLFTVVSVVGLICSVTGVLASVYQARGEIILYAFLITNTITYAWVSYDQALYGQIIQNIILLLPIQIAGFISWKKNLAKSENHQIEIKTFKAWNWVVTIIALIVCWFIYYAFLTHLPEILQAIFGGKLIAPDPSPKLDSLTTVLTVMAMILTSKRYIEQWWFWIFCNIGAVLFIEGLLTTTHFTGPVLVNDLSGMLNWLQYGVGAIYGFYLWKKMHKERVKEA